MALTASRQYFSPRLPEGIHGRGAGTALAFNLNIARGAHAAGSDTIRIALVGCGGGGTAAASQALSTKANVKLVAAADVFRDRMDGCLAYLGKTFKNRFDVPSERRFLGFDAYQKAIDCGVDVVLLTTPPGFRPMMFEAAVAAGKHVFMEKPVAVDAPGVRKVLAASEEANKKGLTVGVGFSLRHEANHKKCVQMIHDGVLGEILYLRALYNNAGVWVRPRQPGQSEMQYQVSNWYYFTWLSGDHIVKQHVYTLELAKVGNEGGQSNPGQRNGGRQVRIGKEFGEIFDHHFNEFDYPDGIRLYSQCRQIPGCWNTGYLTYVYGTKGSAFMGNERECVINPNGKDRITFGHGTDSYQAEHDDLFASIVEGKPYNEAHLSSMATMTAILGRMATYSGNIVKWDEAITRNWTWCRRAWRGTRNRR